MFDMLRDGCPVKCWCPAKYKVGYVDLFRLLWLTFRPRARIEKSMYLVLVQARQGATNI
jgi:hypothetical protein